MKVLKWFLSFILGLLITILLCVFALSFLSKHFVRDQIVGAIVKTELIDEIAEETNPEVKEEIEKFFDEHEMADIIDDTIDACLEILTDENLEVTDETIDKIFDYVEKNETELEQAIGEDINITELKNSKDELKKGLNDGLVEFREDIKEVKSAIEVYKFFTSTKFKVILIVIILALIGLLMLIKGTWYGWLSTFGTSMITSGILVGILYLFMDQVLQELYKEIELNISVSPTNILIYSIVEIVIGIISYVLYFVFKKKFKKTELTVDEK